MSNRRRGVFFRYGVPVVAALALGFATVNVIRAAETRPEMAPPEAPPSTSFAERVGGVGIVEPASEPIAIAVPVAGQVAEVLVAAGDDVRAGDTLFRLDDRERRAELGVRSASAASSRALAESADQRLGAARARLRRLENAPRAELLPPLEAKVRVAKAALEDARIQYEVVKNVADPRAVSDEDKRRRAAAVDGAQARLDAAESELALERAGTWSEDLAVAKADVASAESDAAAARSEVAAADAAVRHVEVDLERLSVTAPVASRVLRVNVRAGEYAPADRLSEPLVVLGVVKPLHVRVDIDEADAWRMREGARAEAALRGRATIRAPLAFVRFEPYVTPKKSLTGAPGERTDTRVLQAIYALEPGAMPVFVGQQVDVFLEAAAGAPGTP
jgi:multidrug resistance efflux pump